MDDFSSEIESEEDNDFYTNEEILKELGFNKSLINRVINNKEKAAEVSTQEIHAGQPTPGTSAGVEERSRDLPPATQDSEILKEQLENALKNTSDTIPSIDSFILEDLEDGFLYNNSEKRRGLENSDPDDPDFVLPSGESSQLLSEGEEEPIKEIDNSLTVQVHLEAVHEKEVEEINDQEEVNATNGTEKRRKKNNKDNWIKTKSKVKREHGEAYLGYRRAGQGKVVQDVPRDAKVMGPRCSSSACGKSKLRACPNIGEEERKKIFTNFWKCMSWDQRKVFVVNLVTKTSISRKRTDEEQSRRKETLKYEIIVNGKRLQVCQKTFLNTLGIKKWTVRYWLQGDGKTLPKLDASENRIVPSSYVTRPSKKGQTMKKEDSEFLIKFLQSLPRLPSHYCRASSTKLYIEPCFESMTELHNLYSQECTTANKTPLSRYTFDKIFEKENLSLFQPKKDQCDVCHSFAVNSGTITENQYNNHILEKNRAKKEKDNDTERAKLKQVHVFTQDTQAVKLAPCVNASAMYYKTKLCVHNFTMFNQATHDAITYWWDETQSDLSASSFASCVVDCLRQVLDQDLKPVIIWSDGCGYQNRSNVLSSALLHLAVEKKVVIEQKYLVKGHTMMECDSVHSTIDTVLNPKRKTKNKKTVREIYLPSQYAQYAREARKKPFPYRSVYLDFSFFTDYSKEGTMAYKSIRPGKKVGEPTVHDLKALKYNPNEEIQFKINFDDEYKLLPSRPNQDISKNFPKLNNARRKIKKSKWDHLQDLKAHIPLDCQPFYDSIPYQNQTE